MSDRLGGGGVRGVDGSEAAEREHGAERRAGQDTDASRGASQHVQSPYVAVVMAPDVVAETSPAGRVYRRLENVTDRVSPTARRTPT
ncbi:hypothetical protein [Agromyces albus]|uniref:hypothetical protein n=1 Tax=Agromyces albus TaxID=205332 RepID=UPI0027855996|nr:hypothetical protein [Agromyces albus]MDQ0574106.1 hypothetical protein [Agromyces albus]